MAKKRLVKQEPIVGPETLGFLIGCGILWVFLSLSHAWRFGQHPSPGNLCEKACESAGLEMSTDTEYMGKLYGCECGPKGD